MSRHFIPFFATRQGAATVELRLDVLYPDPVGPISCATRHIVETETALCITAKLILE
jgi:hypothetical protein